MGTITTQLCRQVTFGQETREFDYKAPASWDESDKKACTALVKDILALANAAGGRIVVGVHETNHGFDFSGLKPAQAGTWETTRLNNFVNIYADPAVNLQTPTRGV